MKKNLIMFSTILAFALWVVADTVCNDIVVDEVNLSGIGSEDERWFREMHDEHCNYRGCW
jgi:hypothetical protein